MELGAAGLQEQPFRTHGVPLIFVAYEAQEQAFQFLNDTYSNYNGMGLFQGPPLSGKSTIIRQFVAMLPGDPAVAVIDGAGLNTTTLLGRVLDQFGYDLQFNSVNELLNMLKVFVLQQTASDHAPLLIVENTHALNPSALRVLCELAALKVRHQSALRLVLASDRCIESIVNAPAMELILHRLTGNFHLQSLTKNETTDYLYAKLRAGGCFDPENVIPDEVCDELYEAAGGWPGIVDRLALLALAKSPYCPIEKQHVEYPVVPQDTISEGTSADDAATQESTDPREITGPQLFLTLNGDTLDQIAINRPRFLIGRSEHNDICINSKFVSRHHAMFIRQGAAFFLMDLNSTNGTYVNSRRVSNQVLVNEDVISVGNHRLKFVDPRATAREPLEGVGFADTVIMKNLEDMRRMLARENTQALPVPPDEITGS